MHQFSYIDRVLFYKNPENSFQRYDLASICLKFDKSDNFSHYDYKPKLQKFLFDSTNPKDTINPNQFCRVDMKS